MILGKKMLVLGMTYFIQLDSGYRIDWTMPNGHSFKRFFKDHDEAELFYQHKCLELTQFEKWKHGD